LLITLFFLGRVQSRVQFLSRYGIRSIRLEHIAKHPEATKHTAKLQAAYWFVLLLRHVFKSTRVATDGEDSRKVHLKELSRVENNPCVDSVFEAEAVYYLLLVY